MKKIVFITFVSFLILTGINILGNIKNNPNKISFIIYNSKKNPEVQLVLTGTLTGHLKGKNPRSKEDKRWKNTFTLKPGQTINPTFYDRKYDYYQWRWGSSQAYILVKPKNTNDDEFSCLKLTGCVSLKWDYKIDERKLGHFKLWLWDNGYRRDYDGRWMDGNFGDDSSDVEWSSFAKINGNHGAIRDGVIVVYIAPINDKRPNSNYYKYNADKRVMTLPKFATPYFKGNIDDIPLKSE
jgi:hypothetical protein